MKKIFALLIAFTMLLGFASCGGNGDEENTTSELVTESTTEATTENNDAVTTLTEIESETETSEAAESESKLPTTPEEILSAYTVVMNKAKSEKVGFTKAEWQSLPDDENSRVVSQGATFVNLALNAANNFMTTEKDAKVKPTVYEKGGDMAEFPIRNTPYGCTLTDTSVIKSIECKELKNGNYKITIVLKNEKNPEPAPDGTDKSPSFHGRLITPISKNQIDETLNGGIVSAVAKDISYSLTFHDVTSTVEYNPETNEIVTLEQTTKVTVSGQGKVAGITMVVDKQELINDKYIYDLKY